MRTCNIIFGAMIDDTMTEKVKITVIATGLDGETPAAIPSFAKSCGSEDELCNKRGTGCFLCSEECFCITGSAAGTGSTGCACVQQTGVRSGEIKIPVFLQRKK